jgi:aldose 1-epimerase
MIITKRNFGKMGDGREVYLFNLSNSDGVEVGIINYGGIIVSISVPDRKGTFNDIALGFDDLDGYLHCNKYFGAIIGRYANRIEDGMFELNGVEYHLAKNDGNNHLHGGLVGFDKVLWDAEIINRGSGECLQLSYLSKNGEEKYPGNLDVKVIYSLSEDNELKIDYYAQSDKDTIVNLSNHSYFNLLGHDAGDINSHHLKIYADRFTAIDENCITTGEIMDVKNTPFDFTQLSPIKPGLYSQNEQIINGGGYDHNWVLNNNSGQLEKAAELYEPISGRFMEVFTTKPGIQFYSGNFLDGSSVCKDGAVYGKRSGLCLETQYFPNSMKYEHFPSPILRASEKYHHTTVYKFSVIDKQLEL